MNETLKTMSWEMSNIFCQHTDVTAKESSQNTTICFPTKTVLFNKVDKNKVPFMKDSFFQSGRQVVYQSNIQNYMLQA